MMKPFLFLAVLAALFPFGALADVEPNYDPGEPYVTTPWYEYISAAQRQEDLDFITGMRPHHAGALSMSEEYLAADGRGSARLVRLADAIIYNQAFEIGVLDEIESLLQKTVIAEGEKRMVQVATDGLAQHQKFSRLPIPSLAKAPGATDYVTETDVIFAKAMIVHHAGAVEMCEGYLQNPNVNNGYLERLCKDIIVDQSQEIALMKDIIADYPGDSDAIKIDPSLIHGMDHMLEHGFMGYDHYMIDGGSAPAHPPGGHPSHHHGM